MTTNASFTPVSSSQANYSLFAAITVDEGVLHVRPAGPALSEREASIIASDVIAAMDRLGNQFKRMVLDLSDVQLMSSFGLGMCIELRHTAQRRGVRTVLYGLSPQLSDLFRMMKVERLYTIARTPRELARAIAA